MKNLHKIVKQLILAANAWNRPSKCSLNDFVTEKITTAKPNKQLESQAAKLNDDEIEILTDGDDEDQKILIKKHNISKLNKFLTKIWKTL